MLLRVHRGRLEVANTIGQRDVECQSLEALEKLGRQVEDRKFQLDLAMYRTRYFLDTGNLSPALEASREMCSRAEALGDGEEIARALSWQAMVYRERSEHSRAIELYTQAEGKTDNPGLKAEIKQERGLTYSYLEQYDLAEASLSQALDYFQRLGSQEMVANIYNDLGVCYYAQRKYREAKSFFLKALAGYQRVGYKLGSATAAGNLVTIFIHQGEILWARKYAVDCLAWGREIEDLITIGMGLEKIGDIQSLSGRYKEALASYRAALECVQQTGDKAMASLLLAAQAEILGRLNDFPEAEQRLAAAMDLARAQEDEIILRRILKRRAVLWYLSADYDAALGQWQNLLDEGTGDDGDDLKSEIMLEMARCWRGKGNLKMVEECFLQIDYAEDRFPLLWSLVYHALGIGLFKSLARLQEAERCRQRANELLARLRENNENSPWVTEIITSGVLGEYRTELGDSD